MMYDSLRLLLQGYLSQDWPFEYGDPWLAVDAFVLNEPPELSTRLVHEIEAVLSADPSEAELKALVVNELDSGYTPEPAITFREWMAELVSRVEDVRQRTDPDPTSGEAPV